MDRSNPGLNPEFYFCSVQVRDLPGSSGLCWLLIRVQLHSFDTYLNCANRRHFLLGVRVQAKSISLMDELL